MDAAKQCPQCGDHLKAAVVSEVLVERCLSCGSFRPVHPPKPAAPPRVGQCSRCHVAVSWKKGAQAQRPLLCLSCAEEAAREQGRVVSSSDSDAPTAIDVLEMAVGVVDLLDD